MGPPDGERTRAPMTSFLPPVSDLSPEQRAVYDTLPLDLTRGLLLTRSSAAPYLALGRSFHDGELPAATRELIILRVGAVTSTQYELFHHIPQARACGVADEVIDKVVTGSRSIGGANLDALMVFVDNLVGGVPGPPPGTETLQEFYSHSEIAEITLIVGHYVMTSLFIKVLGIQPEEPLSTDGR
jgi:alkylhydroperoxidase family enzyme